MGEWGKSHVTEAIHLHCTTLYGGVGEESHCQATEAILYTVQLYIPLLTNGRINMAV